MIKLDFWMSGISFNKEYLNFFNRYNKQIYDVIFYKDFIFIRAGKRVHLQNDNYKLEDNVFKFNNKGKLLFRTGLLKIEYPIDSGNFESWEVSNMNIVNDKLHLGYSRGYEAWYDIKSGEFINGRFENRK